MLNSPMGLISLMLLIGGGLALFLIGSKELTSNYFRNKDIIVREDLLKKYELDKKVKKLPREYREELIL
jgi:hypothetical protein